MLTHKSSGHLAFKRNCHCPYRESNCCHHVHSHVLLKLRYTTGKFTVWWRTVSRKYGAANFYHEKTADSKWLVTHIRLDFPVSSGTCEVKNLWFNGFRGPCPRKEPPTGVCCLVRVMANEFYCYGSKDCSIHKRAKRDRKFAVSVLNCSTRRQPNGWSSLQTFRLLF